MTPYPGNARRGDVRLILESLRTSGQYRSRLARQTPNGHLVVLAGNHTLAALLAHDRGLCTASIPTFANPAASCALCSGTPWEPAARVEAEFYAASLLHPLRRRGRPPSALTWQAVPIDGLAPAGQGQTAQRSRMT
ncbi:hypothetical protein ACFUV2_09235 [Streptomyces pilosus]|uniref:hypothetical protein n=1 Tax=Streptomyces pilosus TaxID=28893 RepID=UPI0036402827